MIRRSVARLGTSGDPHDGRARVELLRAVAALLAQGATLRESFEAHPGVVGRRVRLGASPAEAMEAEGEHPDDLAIAFLLKVHQRWGGDVARGLRSYADVIEEREDGSATARSMGAGARLSGRMVAALPLVVLPLMPLSRAPLFDGIGVGLLLAGTVFALAGLSWIDKLLPEPRSHDDPAAMTAELLGALAEQGVPPRAALSSFAAVGGEQLVPELGAAARRVALGSTWSAALRGSGSLAEIGDILARSERSGAPCASALRCFAEARRAELRREFEAQVRRAPVLMVVPLVTCVLPSFVLLGLGPFARSMFGI